MFKQNKERLYITDIVNNPAISSPAFYTLSTKLKNNEMLHFAIEAVHNYNFKAYYTPKSFNEIFASLNAGAFAIYKEKYIVANFNKLMYLEPNGWKSLPAMQDIFELDNWLVC